MIKHIGLPLSDTPADDSALALASALAGALQAQLSVLRTVTLPLPTAAPWGLSPDPGMGEVYDRLRAQGEAEAAVVRERLAGVAEARVLVLDAGLGSAGHAAAGWLHAVDLAVVGNSPGDSSAGDRCRELIASLLLESGRPVLVVPKGCQATCPPRHAVVAWKAGAGAARALHDALPLLRGAQSVDLVMIDPIAPQAGEASPGSEVLAQLHRHGVAANPVMLKSGRERDSGVLLAHATSSRADLLVAGGYGHSRLRQWALGGMTRELLFEARVPVLFSH